MRGAFRKRRFFVAHTLCLAAASIAMLFGVFKWAADAGGGVNPAEIGSKLFGMFVYVQFVIVLTIFPAFGCTAITEEKVNKSFDLLLTTNLRPFEIVFGKFLSAFVYSSVFIFATIPLVCVSFLFGGVEVGRIVNTYLILVLISFLITVFSIFVSSVAATSTKAVIATYAFLALFMGGGYYLAGFVVKTLSPPGAGEAAPLMDQLDALMRRSGSKANDTEFYFLYAVFLLVGLIAFFFALASNMLKPSAYNRSTTLKILFIIFCALVFTTALVHYTHNAETPVPVEEAASAPAPAEESGGANLLPAVGGDISGDNSTAAVPKVKPERKFRPLYSFMERLSWASVLMTLGSIFALAAVILFASEERRPSIRLRTILDAKYGGWKYPLRIFAPGSGYGAVFGMVFAIAVFAVVGFYFYFYGGLTGLDWPEDKAGEGPVWRGYYSLIYHSASWLAFLLFMTAIAVRMSAAEFRPLITRILLAGVLVGTALMPLLAFAMDVESSAFTFYYLSPVLLTLNSWRLPNPMVDPGGALEVFGIPIHEAGTVIYAVLAFALLWPLMRKRRPAEKSAGAGRGAVEDTAPDCTEKSPVVK
jgi:hypothetical protein